MKKIVNSILKMGLYYDRKLYPQKVADIALGESNSGCLKGKIRLLISGWKGNLYNGQRPLT
jgi:hypothetical protein